LEFIFLACNRDKWQVVVNKLMKSWGVGGGGATAPQWARASSFTRFLDHTQRLTTGDRGSTVVKVLCYKSEGRGLDHRWCHWIFH